MRERNGDPVVSRLWEGVNSITENEANFQSTFTHNCLDRSLPTHLFNLM